MIDVFRLEGARGTQVDKWIEVLATDLVTVRPDERASWAAWSGRPFLLAGNREALDAWFKALDEDSAAVMEDHAFFWILTAGSRYSNKLIPADRIVVLDWATEDQHIIRDALSRLTRFLPRIAGLSKGTQHVREEILRIASGSQGPSTPVLILGESGSGKDGTANCLVEASRRAKSGLYSISGAWLRMDEGLALSELFGIEAGAATGTKERQGLVERYSEGALFVDDFDTASVLIQEQLLRITATTKGEKAKYPRVGGDEERETNVWLIFATNANIEKMLDEKRLRIDFLFRFEDRVLVIPPLRERPADVAAIAHEIWAQAQLLDNSGTLKDRVLPWRSLRELVTRKLLWEGNVRELGALLGLVASMARMPKHRQHSTAALFEQVLERGPSYRQWFGILASRFYTVAPHSTVPDRVRQILSMDAGAPSDGLSPCESEIRLAVESRHWSDLEELVKQHVKRDRARVHRAFCRYLVYVRRFSSISIEDAQHLGGIENAQARSHLRWLSEKSAFLAGPPSGKRANAKLIYRPGKYIQ